MLFKPIPLITGFLTMSCLLSACSSQPAAAGNLSADSSSISSPFVSRWPKLILALPSYRLFPDRLTQRRNQMHFLFN